MLSRLTRRRPCTASFQMAVRTVLPRHSMSRGKPTLTESSRGIETPLRSRFRGASGMGRAVDLLQHLVGVQGSVDAVLLDGLTRIESEFLVVEEDVDRVRLEGDQVGDASNLGPRPQVRPRGPFALADVVVTGKALIGAERLSLDGDQRALVDVLAQHVPARRKAGLVQ